MIYINCSCGESLQTGDEHAGRRIRCPKCQTILTAPMSAEEEDLPAASLDAVRSGQAPLPPAVDGPNDRYERETPRRRYTPPEATSGKAVFSLVLGLLILVGAMVLGFVAPIWAVAIPAAFGLLNLVLALMAIAEVKRSKGRLAGFGLALAGLIVGLVAVPLYIPGYLLKESTSRVRMAAARTQESNNLKQIAISLHAHHDVFKQLPQPGSEDPATRKPLLSWRVHILPYVGQDHLYRQFRLNEPWDSPHNLPLAERMPALFQSVGKPAPANHTTYQFLVGPKTLFPDWPSKGPGALPRKRSLISISDGSSNTFMVAESNKPVLWTKPEDIDYDPARPRSSLGWSMPDRFFALFADGSVRTISNNVPEETLRLLVDPSDGMPINHDALDR